MHTVRKLHEVSYDRWLFVGHDTFSPVLIFFLLYIGRTGRSKQMTIRAVCESINGKRNCCSHLHGTAFVNLSHEAPTYLTSPGHTHIPADSV